MKVLLDTHAFIWLATDPALLGQAARAAIADCDEGLYVSAVTPWEIGLLVKRGRLNLPLDAAEYVERTCRRHGIEEIPVRGAEAVESTTLPDVHGDPFDRLLVALARREGLALVSKDAQFSRYPGVRVIW